MPLPNSSSLADAVASRPCAWRRIGATLGLATAVLFLAGCDLPWSGTPTAEDPEVRPSELTDTAGQPCPQELPIGEDPSGHGFGIEEVADERPTLLAPQEAWVCQYNTFDVGTTASGGAVYGWSRAGRPEPVAATDLPNLQDALDDLAPADRSGGCNDDLGPRWMVIYSHDGDLTGVVVDDYGCRDVRLTDNPTTTPPGADNQEGTVGGVLDGGAAILDVLGVGRSN
ncbi:hypothetical protein [Nocardioides dokdonensis]|uniref:hypothetical protein n=1 Tax=Nocardioides dokdonensis TaxID=450734 RepID=UPI00082E8541|nr:hypothetical protein [Nocardioides dokdonensis]